MSLTGRSSAPRLAAAAAGLAFVLMACGDDGTPPPTTGVTGGPEDAALAATDGSAVDAASITPRPDLCMGLTRGGDAVPEIEVRGNSPPPLGGTIAPGTYDLRELTAYAGDAADGTDPEDVPSSRLTGKAAQITVLVTDNSLRFVEARGAMTEQVATLAPETTRATLYRVEASSLVMTAVCPATAAPSPVSFSAVGTGLAIFPDGKHRELYGLRQ